MQKLENKTLQNFLERFIESLKDEKEHNYNELVNNDLDIQRGGKQREKGHIQSQGKGIRVEAMFKLTKIEW